MTEKPSGLALLREPFAENHISKLPKPTKTQTDAVKADFKAGIRCQLCGGWHHPAVVHLDYVGHAALTDRLLDVDPEWSWEPLALHEGLPAFDQSGGLWIKLTVCGVSRLGYGHAAAKQGQDPGAREKEVIGDALRNAAMRFGAALDLWHKGDLHGDPEADTKMNDAEPSGRATSTAKPASKANSRSAYERLSKANAGLDTLAKFNKFWAQQNVLDAADALPPDWAKALTEEMNDKFAELDERAAMEDDVPFGDRGDYVPPQFDQHAA